jgi:hypothetical protein
VQCLVAGGGVFCVWRACAVCTAWRHVYEVGRCVMAHLGDSLGARGTSLCPLGLVWCASVALAAAVGSALRPRGSTDPLTRIPLCL